MGKGRFRSLLFPDVAYSFNLRSFSTLETDTCCISISVYLPIVKIVSNFFFPQFDGGELRVQGFEGGVLGGFEKEKFLSDSAWFLLQKLPIKRQHLAFP